MIEHSPPQTELQDRITGTLLGLAAGDRIGGPLQFALCLAESLIENAGLNRSDVFRRYLAWYRDGAFDTGTVASRVLSLAHAGTPADSAVTQVDRELDGLTAGCNPAHRVAPIAMALTIPDESVAEAALQEAALTHHHRLAGDAAAAVAVLCRTLIRGASWEAALAHAAQDRLPEIRATLEPTESGRLAPSGFAPETLQAAVQLVNRAAGFQDALVASLHFAGGANYAPVLVGAIGGARWGAGQIPASELAHCTDLQRTTRIAHKFGHAAKQNPQGDRDV
ncbi:ADP-ribosylglycohydrolase family protein [Halorhodospira abdelmalekii]|uniref:ADP-ribosylglycohydrolase family protein n=1 Tax=Halorhodospira abdelmalekii TaxID=421629 RepID=UPI001906D686|nr:ADP-ribosylglycohydrolase family protein [Halorhodospira abdelmalekii]